MSIRCRAGSVFCAALLCGLSLAACGGEVGPPMAGFEVDYPLADSIFPPDFAPPTFLWHDAEPGVERWRVTVTFQGGAESIDLTVPGDPPPAGTIDPDCIGETNELYEPTPYQRTARSWTPDPTIWEAMKAGAREGVAVVMFRGVVGQGRGRPVSVGTTTFTTSKDPVGAPIFYRDVPLMPAVGETGRIKPLSRNGIPLIAWRLKDVGRPDSRVLLRSMPACANCHSFSADGRTLGMDVDGPDGDKGAYTLIDLEPETTIRSEDVITWSSFEKKLPGHKTLGFLSRVSPDGRHAITTLNEALYVRNFVDYRFLQVFYPTRGILAWYSRDSGAMESLPGADDPEYVHCDPAWTPDGKHIVFARATARDPYIPGRPEATYAGDPNETPIQYDLYRMPFRGGEGGTAVPIEGAAANGMSNTFPKVSPDGRWIVFVKCKNGQLMRPDGRLWIVPVTGGEAREMRCNTKLMNSWHSFSPNGRWMVFSSKSNTPYTQMFLTHIDADGNDSPAILIPNATAANRAVNIPEFVNAPYESLRSIEVPAVSHYLDLQRGVASMEGGDYDAALSFFESALQKDPEFSRAHVNLGRILTERGKLDDAIAHYEKALKLNPRLPMAYVNLGFALSLKRKPAAAIAHYRRALAIDPDHALAHNNLGYALLQQKRVDEALQHLRRAVTLDPDDIRARSNLGLALQEKGDTAGAQAQYEAILARAPDAIAVHANLSRIHFGAGRRAEGVKHLARVVELDRRDVQAAKALAWQLATAPEADVRDGKRALALLDAVLKGNAPTPALLDVLAAAHAEAGAFAEAAKAAEKALALLGGKDAAFAARVRARLALYKAGKPYRTPE